MILVAKFENFTQRRAARSNTAELGSKAVAGSELKCYKFSGLRIFSKCNREGANLFYGLILSLPYLMLTSLKIRCLNQKYQMFTFSWFQEFYSEKSRFPVTQCQSIDCTEILNSLEITQMLIWNCYRHYQTLRLYSHLIYETQW